MDNLPKNIPDSAIVVIEQIWHRARINAFAHREAMQDYSASETKYFKFIIITSLLSILSIILMYVTTTEMEKESICKSILTICFTLASIVLAVWSLYYAIMSNHKRFAIKAEEHKFLMNSYQHIAQRAREVKWPEKPHAEIIELLRDLERDFALLKARGNEPLDKHYEAGHEVFKKVRDDKDSRIAQSFEIDTEFKDK